VASAANVASAAKEKATELVLTIKKKVKDMATATSELAVQSQDKAREWRLPPWTKPMTQFRTWARN
jgi:hypothetical protein